MQGDDCPLCGGTSAPFHHSDRLFLSCGACALVFVPARQHLSLEQERSRYSTHRNSPEDSGYRAFLDRLLIPLTARLVTGACGLDYGSGPGPAVSTMMRERGFVMADYDPFFAPDEAPLRATYDFVTCTEVVEHLRRPIDAFSHIDALLRPGGVFGILTGVLESDNEFAPWWYHRDVTHIAFYRPNTLEWIARHFHWRLERASRDAAFFQKFA